MARGSRDLLSDEGPDRRRNRRLKGRKYPPRLLRGGANHAKLVSARSHDPMRRAVFLDRDNTLMANDGDCGDPAQVQLLPGVGGGVQRLHAAGFALVVVTNQGGVARGRYDEGDVELVHRRLASMIDGESGVAGAISRFYFCPFHPEGTVERYRREHPWRKPGAGMLLQAALDLELDLVRSWLIGDAERDVVAGRTAGCRTVLIAGGNPGARVPASATGVPATIAFPDLAAPDFTAPDFTTAVELLLGAEGAA